MLQDETGFPDGEWEKMYKVLNDADIQGYQDPNRLCVYQPRQGIHKDDQLEDLATQNAANAVTDPTITPLSHLELFNDEHMKDDGTGETRRTLSWIWLSQASDTSNNGVPDEDNLEDITNSKDILQAEWAKSCARAARWTEEVMLLKEEMCRTLSFLNWRADWWEKKPTQWVGISIQLEEGICAYAYGQAKSQRALAVHFGSLWKDPLSNDNVLSGTTAADLDTANIVDENHDNDGNDDDNDDDDDEGADGNSDGGDNQGGDSDSDIEDTEEASVLP